MEWKKAVKKFQEKDVNPKLGSLRDVQGFFPLRGRLDHLINYYYYWKMGHEKHYDRSLKLNLTSVDGGRSWPWSGHIQDSTQQ